MAEPPVDITRLPNPRFCYLEIPALDARASAAFYAAVFGWKLRQRDTAAPRFDDACGVVSGMWVTGRVVAAEPGLLPSIMVDSIAATLERVRAHGGGVAKEPAPDAPGSACLVAWFRDPAGNILGLYQEG
ncbi:MAG: VOC family protein [Terriglobales bacterium]